MSAEPPFGWIEPRDADRGMSWARVKAGETFAAHGTSAVVREVLRTEVAAYARDLRAEEIDGALDWAARRLACLREAEAEAAAPLRAFEARARAVLEVAPASRCAEARRGLLAEDHGLTPQQALETLALIAPPCPACTPAPDRPRAPAESLRAGRLGW